VNVLSNYEVTFKSVSDYQVLDNQKILQMGCLQLQPKLYKPRYSNSGILTTISRDANSLRRLKKNGSDGGNNIRLNAKVI
jgi:hypothetical protein